MDSQVLVESHVEQDHEFEEELRPEASLLSLTMRREGKVPVMVLDEQDAEDGFRETEMAAAQRMLVEDGELLELARENFPVADLADIQSGSLSFDQPEAQDWVADADSPVIEAAAPWGGAIDLPSPEVPAEEVIEPSVEVGADYDDQADAPHEQIEGETEEAEVYLAPPSRHSLRSTIRLAQPDSRGGLGDWWSALVQRIKWMLFKP